MLNQFMLVRLARLFTAHKIHCWGKNNALEEGKLLLGKFCDFEGKNKKYIKEICHSGGKFGPDCREIIILSRPDEIQIIHGSWGFSIDHFASTKLNTSYGAL